MSTGATESKRPIVRRGDYVLASKYKDGDPGDHFCVGFYAESYDHFGEIRHLVTDKEGKNFRANGFRRVARIGRNRGAWMVTHFPLIESMVARYSVWHWYRATWKELRTY
jgi:hypothetical protein